MSIRMDWSDNIHLIVRDLGNLADEIILEIEHLLK